MSRRDSVSHEWKGPIKKHSCTDVPCLLIFLASILAWIIVGIYAYTYGDYTNLWAPKDSRGRRCGVDNEVSKKSFLVFFDITKCVGSFCNTPQVCRSECPQINWIFETQPSTDLETIRKNMLCESHVNVTNKNYDQLKHLIEAKACAAWYLKSTPVFRRCFPASETLANFIKNISLSTVIKEITKAEVLLDKMDAVKVPVILFIFGSLVISLVYITLLRWIAFPCIYIGIICLTVLLCVLGYICYEKYVESEKSSVTWLVMTIILGVAAGVVIILAICLCQRIRLACQLITEAGICIVHILSSLFFPIVPWLMHLGIIAYFIYIGLYLLSMGDQQFTILEKLATGACVCPPTFNITEGATCNADEFYESCKEDGESCVSISCNLSKTASSLRLKILYVIHVLGFIWAYLFITALCQMILAGTFATWYWTFKKKDIPWFPIIVSTWRTIRYHIGTLAFGSFLITICKVLKLFLKWLSNHSTVTQPQSPNCGQFCCGSSIISKCCVSLIESLLKFMNRNAYIICYINGSKGLCASASEALSLVVKNGGRLFVLTNLINILIFLGKIVVMSAMISSGWWYFKHSGYYSDDIGKEYWWLPVVVVAIGSYLIANLVFMVETAAVNTIFFCFLEDCEINDGSNVKPYYMSKRLGKLLHVKNE